MITILIILYIIGFIITYIICKKLRNKQDNNEWSDVRLSIVIAFMSFIGLILILIIWLIVVSNEYINEHDLKPPTFL